MSNKKNNKIKVEKNQVSKTSIITILLLVIVVAMAGFAGGYFIGTEKESSYSPYDIIFQNLEDKTDGELMDYYQGLLKAETSPTQLKYILNHIMKRDIDDASKNNMFAMYLNHIQYYMSNYSNVVSLYDSIMMNNRSTVNYEDPASANQINDLVLKTLIQEIYASNLKIIMPPVGALNSYPYIIVDYDGLKSEFGEVFNQATLDYIAFKEVAQKGELYSPNGNYDTEKMGKYIVQADKFIMNYSSYPLISDVLYSYILASKMYINTYSVENEFLPTAAQIESYEAFVEANPNTPVSNIIKTIIEKYNNNEPITVQQANEWNQELDSLMGES